MNRPDPADIDRITAVAADDLRPLHPAEVRQLAAEVVALRAELAEAKAKAANDDEFYRDLVKESHQEADMAKAAYERERAAREAAERERDEANDAWRSALANGAHNVDILHARAEAAEADAKQLREALEQIAAPFSSFDPKMQAIARAALGSAAAANKLDSCPHCGLKGKPFCWCGEHAPVREAAADSQENPA
jgi:hypothetical protein